MSFCDIKTQNKSPGFYPTSTIRERAPVLVNVSCALVMSECSIASQVCAHLHEIDARRECFGALAVRAH